MNYQVNIICINILNIKVEYIKFFINSDRNIYIYVNSNKL